MKTELKILLLEDIPEEAVLIERTIKKNGITFISKRVDTAADFKRELIEFNPDIVLSDHALPQFNSIQALILAREHNQNLPFILVTGTVSEEFAVTCLKQGADDYVLKSNLSRLPTALVNALNNREAQEKKENAENEVRLHNEELRLTNSQLVKSNTELDNFVYSISHNIRAPLSSILGLINVAKMEDPSRNDWYMQMMEQSVHRLDQTLKEILDYSRNGRTELNVEPVDPKSLFHETLEKLKYIPGSEMIVHDFEDENELPWSSDKYRVTIIMNNLISNAIKYRDPGKEINYIKVKVTVADTVTLRFEDNGIGINKAHLEKIFNMFFRGTEISDGAGLGLYIAKEAVDKLKGEIRVESEEKIGTVFTVVLPLLPADFVIQSQKAKIEAI